MITRSMNAGFGAPLSADEIQQMQDMALGGVRTEIHAAMSEDQIVDVLLPLVSSGLDVLVLLHGETMSGVDLAQQCGRVVRLAAMVDLLIDLELQNEPDLAGTPPEEMADRCLLAYEELRRGGFTGRILGGTVMNLHRDGLDYLKAMRWSHLPSDLLLAVHRYAPRNQPGASHLGSLRQEIEAAMTLTGRMAPSITEFGYHTAQQSAAWSAKPPFYQHAFRLTNEQAAAAIVHDLAVYESCGCPRADVFQWNNGVPVNDEDYEALYGVRNVSGDWLPQAFALAKLR